MKFNADVIVVVFVMKDDGRLQEWMGDVGGVDFCSFHLEGPFLDSLSLGRVVEEVVDNVRGIEPFLTVGLPDTDMSVNGAFWLRSENEGGNHPGRSIRCKSLP